jgi:hypothetical protein
MKLRTWLVIGAVAFALLKAKYPRWYEDLMLRAYARDQIPPPRPVDPDQQKKYDTVAMVSAAAGLPIGWVLEIASKVRPEDLAAVAKRISAKVISMGPPKDTQPETLQSYKQTAIDAGGVA